MSFEASKINWTPTLKPIWAMMIGDAPHNIEYKNNSVDAADLPTVVKGEMAASSNSNTAWWKPKLPSAMTVVK